MKPILHDIESLSVEWAIEVVWFDVPADVDVGKRGWISLEMRPRLVIYQLFLVVIDEDQSMHESLRNSFIMHELSCRSVDPH